MTPRRRLKKGDQELIDVAADISIERMRALVMEIETELVETLIPSVPADLRGEAVRAFMNRFGRELFTATDIVIALEG